MKKVVILASTDRGVQTAYAIQKEFPKSVIASTRGGQGISKIETIATFLEGHFHQYDGFIFIGALGICVRSIAPYIQDKNTDPAVINLDEGGKYVQSVLSGHIGGANDFAQKVASITGGQAIITTSSDLQEIWALDTLGAKFGWVQRSSIAMNELISIFVNNTPTAVLLDVKNKGTEYLEKTLPAFAQVFYAYQDIDFSKFRLLISVTYKVYQAPVPSLSFYPKVLSLGMGCNRDIAFNELEAALQEEFNSNNLAFEAIRNITSIDIKGNEKAFLQLQEKLGVPFITFNKDQINTIEELPSPSETVLEKIGVEGVSESTALLGSGNSLLLTEKKKVQVASGKYFTWAVAMDKESERKAQIVIIGAGPGDAALITVKGKNYLEKADLVLYAGSLIPEELTHMAKSGAIVRNSAAMTLEEQMNLMEEHYNRGHLVARLQCGDPSLYGAIQEQMTLFDDKGMDYIIVPGVSSYQAAAAVLKSEFTIPATVQTVILTRGEGETPMPPDEKLNEMAKHKATMCIFLSAQIANKVQDQLLEHYHPETPIAVLYRVTWQDEKIWTGNLTELANIIKQNKLTRTVLIIVGEAIGARKNRSHLYNPEWKHIFRTGKEFLVKS